jgi:pimeloyl-ACP methyl ester carboxylesterase
MSRLRPRIRPFGRADFDDPRVRRAAERLVPDSDLAALDGQQRVRRLSIPTRAFNEVWRLLRETQRLTLPKALPTLVVQGTRDPWVRTAHTRRLLERLPTPLRYREVAATHTLMGPRSPAWPEVERTVLEFADGIRESAARAATAVDGT